MLIEKEGIILEFFFFFYIKVEVITFHKRIFFVYITK
jgi:hypothetical protein